MQIVDLKIRNFKFIRELRIRDMEQALILVENPEIFLHPGLHRECGDILYRLSREAQVIFSTQSPNLLSNFNSRQIRQMVQG